MDIWVGPTCLYWKYYNSILNKKWYHCFVPGLRGELFSLSLFSLPSTGMTLRRYSMSKGKKEKPHKMVGGVKSRLESNFIPTRDAQRA